jgi:DNA-binding NarL/FixJ family response regulator
MLTDADSVRQAVRLGAGAYVLKDRATDECEPACRAVLAGTHYISSSIARGWLENEPAVAPLHGPRNPDDRTPQA